MTGPLLVVLHLIPQGVLAGLFLIMGVQALQTNGITQKLVFLAQDRKFTPESNRLKRLDRRMAIWAFVALELIGFGATFAITQTIAAIGFPVFIFLLIPIRSFLMPRWFTQEELSALDAPTASPFTMESVGGTYGYDSSYYNRSGVLNNHHDSGSESVVEDDLERGEVHQLHSMPSLAMMRRRSTTSR